MAKKGSVDTSSSIETGSDNWNVADVYSKIKIMRVLQFFDDLSRIAEFGTINIEDVSEYPENFIKRKRVEALQRYFSEIKLLIRNTYFAVKKEGKEAFDSYDNRLNNIKEFLSKCYSTYAGDNYNEESIDIKEEMFSKILDIFNDIVREMYIHLNKASLIFRESEEVDLDKIVEDIVQGG